MGGSINAMEYVPGQKPEETRFVSPAKASTCRLAVPRYFMPIDYDSLFPFRTLNAFKERKDGLINKQRR